MRLVHKTAYLAFETAHQTKAGEGRGEAFNTQSCYFAFRNVFMTSQCCSQQSLPAETSSTAIRSGFAGDTLMGCSSFLSVSDNDRVTCVYFTERLHWQLWQHPGSPRPSKWEKWHLCLKKRNAKPPWGLPISNGLQQCILLEHKAEQTQWSARELVQVRQLFSPSWSLSSNFQRLPGIQCQKVSVSHLFSLCHRYVTCSMVFWATSQF